MTEHRAADFDAAEFQVWLGSQVEPGSTNPTTNQQAVNLLNIAYQRLDGDAGWLVDATLKALHRGHERGFMTATAAWAYGDGVSDVRVWPVADEKGGSDGLVGEVTVDGVRLSLGRFHETQLVPTEHDLMPGYEAAEHALEGLSRRVSGVVQKFRAKAVAGAPMDDEDVVDAEDVGVEVVDDRTAYQRAADAVDNDVNHPAHPMHW